MVEAKRILVTGASGFIGGHVCEALAAMGLHVRAMARSSSDIGQLSGVDIELCRADLRDAASLERACAGMDLVVHCAAAVGSFGEWVVVSDGLLDAFDDVGDALAAVAARRSARRTAGPRGSPR